MKQSKKADLIGTLKAIEADMRVMRDGLVEGDFLIKDVIRVLTEYVDGADNLGKVIKRAKGESK